MTGANAVVEFGSFVGGVRRFLNMTTETYNSDRVARGSKPVLLMLRSV